MKRVKPSPGRRVANQGPDYREGWVPNQTHPLAGWVWVHWDDIGITDEAETDITDMEVP